MSYKEDIKSYIKDSIISENIEFGDTDSLYDLNILDSLGTIQLIGFMQNKFDISIQPEDIELEEFETINRINELLVKLKHD